MLHFSGMVCGIVNVFLILIQLYKYEMNGVDI